MSNKATHSGHCQLCGRLQKLPDGVLAKHGYTKEWGFFDGTCPGSGFLPYEVSCDQVKARIPQIADRAELERQVIKTLRTNPLPEDEMQVWAYKYVRYGVSGYRWIETRVEKVGQSSYQYWDDQGHRPGWQRTEGDWRKGDKTAQQYFMEKYLAYLTSELVKVEQYHQWLERRAAEWTLKETIPCD